jgi:segregation and condensation protein B
MATPDDTPTDADPLALGRAAASQLGGGDWQLDAVEEPAPDGESGVRGQESGVRSQESEKTEAAQPSGVLLTPDSCLLTPERSDLPPSPEQLVEAMLFVGGHPLTDAVACAAVRGLTSERFRDAVAALNRRYREQRRPYAVEARDDGFVLAVRPGYRSLRERLFGGPREARLSQPALDVLSVVAYRQPVGKAEVDAIRGTDSGAVLRQLVRLGLVAVRHRADAAAREVRYGTTARFLQVFGLGSLDELPRLGDTTQV